MSLETKNTEKNKVRIRWFNSADDRDSTLFGILAFVLVFYMLREFRGELTEVVATLAGTVIGSVTTIIAYHFREKKSKSGGNDNESNSVSN